MHSAKTAIHPNSHTDHGEQHARYTGFTIKSPPKATIFLEPKTNDPPELAILINEAPVARRSGRATRIQVATYTDSDDDVDDEGDGLPGSRTRRGQRYNAGHRKQGKGRATSQVARGGSGPSRQNASKSWSRKVNVVIR